MYWLNSTRYIDLRCAGFIMRDNITVGDENQVGKKGRKEGRSKEGKRRREMEGKVRGEKKGKGKRK